MFQENENIVTWTEAPHDTSLQDAWNTTGGLNHREGGSGVQLAVELACVVGHFGSRRRSQQAVKILEKKAHPPTPEKLMKSFIEN